MKKVITIILLVFVFLIAGCSQNGYDYEENCTPNEEGEYCCIEKHSGERVIEKECRQRDKEISGEEQ